MRSLSPSALQSSQFSNERYYPSFVDTVYGASPEGREEIRKEMHRTNYSGVEPELLRNLYSERYLGQLTGQDRTSMITMADLVGAVETEDGVVLELADRTTGEITRLERDLVFLGTGFVRGMPSRGQELHRGVAASRSDREPPVPVAARRAVRGGLLPARDERGHPRRRATRCSA